MTQYKYEESSIKYWHVFFCKPPRWPGLRSAGPVLLFCLLQKIELGTKSITWIPNSNKTRIKF